MNQQTYIFQQFKITTQFNKEIYRILESTYKIIRQSRGLNFGEVKVCELKSLFTV